MASAWFRPLVHRSSSSSGLRVWAFGTLGLKKEMSLSLNWKRKRDGGSPVPLKLDYSGKREAPYFDLQTSGPERNLHSCSLAPQQMIKPRSPPSLAVVYDNDCNHVVRSHHCEQTHTRRKDKKDAALLHSRAPISYQAQELPLQTTITAVSGENRQPIRARRLI